MGVMLTLDDHGPVAWEFRESAAHCDVVVLAVRGLCVAQERCSKLQA
jgi:hypothetical protein